MINGVNSNNPYIGNNGVVRDRADGARASAARPELLSDDRQQARPLPAGGDDGDSVASLPEDTGAYLRRVEARSAVEDSGFERFRAEDIPLANARALEMFATVASHRDGLDGYDAELAGIDIHV